MSHAGICPGQKAKGHWQLPWVLMASPHGAESSGWRVLIPRTWRLSLPSHPSRFRDRWKKYLCSFLPTRSVLAWEQAKNIVFLHSKGVHSTMTRFLVGEWEEIHLFSKNTQIQNQSPAQYTGERGWEELMEIWECWENLAHGVWVSGGPAERLQHSQVQDQTLLLG